MTRRIELADFPVSFAASLTVRNCVIVGEGSGEPQPTRVRPVGNPFQRRSGEGVKESFRSDRGLLSVSSDWLPNRFHDCHSARFRQGSDDLPKPLYRLSRMKTFRDDSKYRSTERIGSRTGWVSRGCHGRGEWSSHRYQTGSQTSRSAEARSVSERIPADYRDSISR